MTEPFPLAEAVLAQAVLDAHLGLDGKTKAGNAYPGGWRKRHGPTKERMRELRRDANRFFFADSHREVRTLWFRLAGFERPLSGRLLKAWLADTISARHPREPYCIFDEEDDVI